MLGTQPAKGPRMSFIRLFHDVKDMPRVSCSEFLRKRQHLKTPDRIYPCVYKDDVIRWVRITPIAIGGEVGGMLEYVPRPTRGDIAAFILDLSR